MPVDPNDLRMTMRQWVAGVTVVTSVLEQERVGMTVSSFTSVSLEPPMVLVCLKKDTYTHEIVMQSRVFAISMLSQGQVELSNRFAGFDPTHQEHFQRFEDVATTTMLTGCPLINGAVGWLDCEVREMVETGTHFIYIGEVMAAQVENSREPLAYSNRTYQRLSPVQE